MISSQWNLNMSWLPILKTVKEEHMINKQAISVTLQRDNVTWLKGRADTAGCKSVSEFLDRLVSAARTRGMIISPRSVVGTIEIDPSDPSLSGADRAVQTFFGIVKRTRGRGKPPRRA